MDYNQQSKYYDALHDKEQLQKARIILKLLHPKPEEKILDVGCGTGLYFSLFPCSIEGIDASEGMINECKKKGHRCNVGRAEQLPFTDKSFDSVICITAMHNFSDVAKALREIKRVCRKTFACSLLKKSKRYEELRSLIEQEFKVLETVDEVQDTILSCQSISKS
ncbi:methyltransferase domain-containing protein [Candidatus Woesearchaeota archaeon]|nr:methyltransferase domain-containing protein [Candidatus Woesearchaeota archaeon]